MRYILLLLLPLVLAFDMADYKQIKPAKDINGVTYERHIYDGPKGKGIVNIYRKTINRTNYVMYEHDGPEARNYPVGWVVEEPTL